jgi:predicted Na+-dependent transporter
VVPITAPLLAYAFFGTALTLSPLALGLKLLTMLVGSLLVAAAIRWTMGAAAIRRHALAIDGFNILVLFVFVAAVMGTVVGSFLVDPLNAIALTVLAFVVFFILLGVTTLVFRKLGHERALALGFMVSQRNMALMLAATDGVLPGMAWLYFALSQFPIYLSPQLLKPILRKSMATRDPAPLSG